MKPDPAFPLPACALMANVNLSNHFYGGAPHGVNLKAQDIQAYPFIRPEAAIPPLGLGEAQDVTLVFEKLNPFTLAGNTGQIWYDDWMYLYTGGHGSLSAFTSTVSAVAGAKNQAGLAEKLECSASAATPVQIPK